MRPAAVGRSRHVRAFKEAAVRATVQSARRLLGSPRWARLPARLFEARLGWMFGGRLLLLHHTGRTTGRPRKTVLEVLAQPAPGVYVVAVALGPRADWYRNIQADPHVSIDVGSIVGRPARARPVTDPVMAQVFLEGFAWQHPAAWRGLRQLLDVTFGADTPPALVEVVSTSDVEDGQPP